MYALSSIWILFIGSPVWGELPTETLIKCFGEKTEADARITALKIITNMMPIVAIWIPWSLTPKWWQKNKVKRRALIATYFIWAIATNFTFLIRVRGLSINAWDFRHQLLSLALLPTLLLASKWWCLEDKTDEDTNLILLFAVLLALLFSYIFTIN